MNPEASPSYGASGHYDANYFAWQSSGADVKARLRVERLGPYVPADATVIDFGSAGGRMLAGLPGSRKIGIELNDASRAASIETFGHEAYKTVADAPDGIADVVVSSHTLEHLTSPYEALVELRSKLKPEGRLVLLLPIDDWRPKKNRDWDPTDVNRHLYTWNPMLLGNLLDEAGYVPQEMRIIHRTLGRGFDRLGRLPRPAFEAVQWLWSRARHRQELLAVATLK